MEMSNTGKPKPMRRHRAVEGDSESDREFTCTEEKKRRKEENVDDLTRLTMNLIAESFTVEKREGAGRRWRKMT